MKYKVLTINLRAGGADGLDAFKVRSWVSKSRSLTKQRGDHKFQKYYFKRNKTLLFFLVKCDAHLFLVSRSCSRRCLSSYDIHRRSGSSSEG